MMAKKPQWKKTKKVLKGKFFDEIIWVHKKTGEELACIPSQDPNSFNKATLELRRELRERR